MASEALEEERKKYQVTLTKDERLHVKKSIRWLTLKRPTSLTPAERTALEVVRQTIPALAEAYDFKESFYQIYDEQDKASAMRAFEAWENSLPSTGLDMFRSLAKTVHNHYEDIFAYWDSPSQITNAYTECLNGLIKVSNRMGRGYSYEIIRAKTLYAKHARKVGSGVRLAFPPSASRMGGLKQSSTVLIFRPWLRSQKRAVLTETGSDTDSMNDKRCSSAQCHWVAVCNETERLRAARSGSWQSAPPAKG